MKKGVYIFFVAKTIHTNKDNCDQKLAEKMLYKRQNFPESVLYGSTKRINYKTYRIGGRTLQLEQTRGPSDAAREG